MFGIVECSVIKRSENGVFWAGVREWGMEGGAGSWVHIAIPKTV